MGAKLKRLATTLTITIILLSFASINLQKVFSDDAGGQIDLFTQKEPYSGKGANTPSDAFGPGDIVILYALVTYNEAPLQNFEVTFHVESPDGSSFTLPGNTNESGVAVANFTIPHKCENTIEVFGEWFVLASVSIAADVYQDTLTFRVDWIIELLSVRTLDENLTHQIMFGVGGDVGLEVALRNIAMVSKNVTIAIVIQDESMVPVSSFSTHNFEVPPNERTVTVYFKLFLPKWARVGKATVYVVALTAPPEEGGVPYCPEISTEFYIRIPGPMTIDFHDASIAKVVSSATSVRAGEPVYLQVTVRNEGTIAENFTVNAYYDSVLIGSADIVALEPYVSIIVYFVFDTSAVAFGNYTIAIFIPHLINEADLSDNLLECAIEVKPARQYYLTVRTDTTEIIIISGEGWYDEGTNVTLTAPEYVTMSTGVRYEFNNWDVDGAPIQNNPIVVAMNANHTATAHYVLQYYLTVASSYGTVGGEGWYAVNTTAYATLDISTIDYENSTRRVFISWGGDASGTHFMQSNGIFMNKPKTAVAQWKTQYYLGVGVVSSGIVTIPGEGWYNQFENVTLTAPQVEEYTFDDWDIDGTFQNAESTTITIFMNAPHTATAHYRSQGIGEYFPWWSLFWYLFIPLFLALLILLALLYRRRRKKKEETFYRGWTAWYYQYNILKRKST